MTVTEVAPHTKTRYKVSLDGKFAFVLYKGELSCFGIREGAELSGDTVEEIRTRVILKRAKVYALHLLGDMDRTEAQLREKLLRGLYPEDIVSAAVEYVKSFGYLDDARYAQNIVLSRMGRKSRREIEAELIRKGVPKEAAREALQNCYEEAGEEEAIRKILQRKRFSPSGASEEETRKIYGYLARKGFRYDAVRQVIQKYEDDA